MALHAKLSASQTARWWTCPGSQAWFEANPELVGGSGHFAQLGTAAHCLVEESLTQGLPPYKFEGRIIQIKETEAKGEHAVLLKPKAKAPKQSGAIWFEVDNEMIEAVEEMTEYVIWRLVDQGAISEELNDLERAREAAKLAAKKDYLDLEGKTNPLPNRTDTGGTTDVTIDTWPEMLEVIDYKNGSGVYVPIEGNKQLRSYILGKAEKTGFSHEMYRYTIIQPRHMDSRGPRSEDITREDLIAWGVELNGRAAMVDKAREAVAGGADLEALYKMGALSVGENGSHCLFCDLLTNCPAASGMAQTQAMVDFDDDEAGPIEAAGENRLHTILPWVPFFDKWIKEMEANAERLLLAGSKVEGYKLVRKRSNRTWRTTIQYVIDPETKTKRLPTDEELADKKADFIYTVEGTDKEIAKLLLDEFELATDKVLVTETTTKRLTGPQTEKLIPKSKRGQFSELFLYKPEAGLTMAHADDKRPEVVSNPEADFDDDLEDGDLD